MGLEWRKKKRQARADYVRPSRAPISIIQKYQKHNGSRSKTNFPFVATPLWVKCEGEAHTPKSGKL
jgi:hypothetical protein